MGVATAARERQAAWAGSARAIASAAGGDAPEVVVGQVVAAIAEAEGLALGRDGLRLPVPAAAPAALVELVRVHAGAGGMEELPGLVHEALLDRVHRHARGVYYTPADVAVRVVDLAVEGRGPTPPVVCDPSVGGGAFVLAAARRLERDGWDRRTIVERAVVGVDVDPLAVAVTEASLALWAAAAGEVVRAPRLVVADTLLQGHERLATAGVEVGAIDAIVGNPPFQNQLGRDTARSPATIELLRERFGPIGIRYVDTAVLFLYETCRWLRPGGRAALVLPQSMLVADDARPWRDALLDLAELEHLWIAREAVFAADAQVCVPVLRRRGPAVVDGGRATVTRSHRRTFAALDPAPLDAAALASSPTWGGLVGDLFGAPAVELGDGPTLASFCTATAGFRDQYYGLAPFVREATDDEVAALRVGDTGVRLAPLVTCGLVDPVRSRWSREPTRFARTRWAAPVVDLDALLATGSELAAWTSGRLVPKVVVATQTRVLEAAVDPLGAWYPSVPTIALVPAPDRLWHAAAIVMAPAVSAWALGRHPGAALTADAIKVSARQLLAVPLPTDEHAWDAGARAAEAATRAAAGDDAATWRASLEELGAQMQRAYRAPDAVLAWWLARLPPWR